MATGTMRITEAENLLPPDILIRKTVQSPKSTPLLTAVARAAR